MSTNNISSIVSSVATGISEAKISGDANALKEAIRSFDKPEGDSFSSSTIAKFMNTPIAPQASISSPAKFYKNMPAVEAGLVRSKDIESSLNNSRLNEHQGIDGLIKKWEEKLNAVGDDAQLANVDLQNILQKQQQTLQMLSNFSKMLYDTAQGIIRKKGG